VLERCWSEVWIVLRTDQRELEKDLTKSILVESIEQSIKLQRTFPSPVGSFILPTSSLTALNCPSIHSNAFPPSNRPKAPLPAHVIHIPSLFERNLRNRKSCLFALLIKYWFISTETLYRKATKSFSYKDGIEFAFSLLSLLTVSNDYQSLGQHETAKYFIPFSKWQEMCRENGKSIILCCWKIAFFCFFLVEFVSPRLRKKIERDCGEKRNMKYKGHKFHVMLGKSPLFTSESTRRNFYLKIKFIVFNFFRSLSCFI
jgi:hypothetical protein